MKYQPNKDYKSSDVFLTPEDLSKKIIDYFNPQGAYLDPCFGNGSFFNQVDLEEKYWCEIELGVDFLTFDKKVDWIITNPPWSKVTPFLEKSVQVSNNIVYLITINHLWTNKRQRVLKENGFSIKEIILIDWPRNFPKSGFSLGVVHMSKDDNETIIFNDWRD